MMDWIMAGLWVRIGWAVGELALMLAVLLGLAVIFVLVAWRHPNWLK